MDGSGKEDRNVSQTDDGFSSPSIQRCISSDEAWQSETTGTSEGNLSLSQYPLDEGSASSSVQDSLQEEQVNCAIMEVSGELSYGNYLPSKIPSVPSGSSESSDISDGEHHGKAGGIIARYPESSTGMSDNDWNPYATESDTNQTPRSNGSEDRKSSSKDGKSELCKTSALDRVKFDDEDDDDASSRSSKHSARSPIVTDGSNVRLDDHFRNGDRTSVKSRSVSSTNSEEDTPRVDLRDEYRSTLDGFRDYHGAISDNAAATEKLDILKYIIDGEERGRAPMSGLVGYALETQPECGDLDSLKHQGFLESRSRENGHSRGDFDSGVSLDQIDTRKSGESTRSSKSDNSGKGRVEPLTYDQMNYGQGGLYTSLKEDSRWSSGESGRSTKSDEPPNKHDDDAASTHSHRSDRSRGSNPRFEEERRDSAESAHSVKSSKSGRSEGSLSRDLAEDRLDRLSNAGDNIKELIEMESSHRQLLENRYDSGRLDREDVRDSGDVIRRVMLANQLELPAENVPSYTDRGRGDAASIRGYVPVEERERLLYSSSPDLTSVRQQIRKSLEEKTDEKPLRDGENIMTKTNELQIHANKTSEERERTAEPIANQRNTAEHTGLDDKYHKQLPEQPNTKVGSVAHLISDRLSLNKEDRERYLGFSDRHRSGITTSRSLPDSTYLMQQNSFESWKGTDSTKVAKNVSPADILSSENLYTAPIHGAKAKTSEPSNLQSLKFSKPKPSDHHGQQTSGASSVDVSLTRSSQEHQSSGGLPRSPSDDHMKRLTRMVEETKKQVKEAVGPVPRPDPSGSEERFPLKERYSYSHLRPKEKEVNTVDAGKENEVPQKLETPGMVKPDELREEHFSKIQTTSSHSLPHMVPSDAMMNRYKNECLMVESLGNPSQERNTARVNGHEDIRSRESRPIQTASDPTKMSIDPIGRNSAFDKVEKTSDRHVGTRFTSDGSVIPPIDRVGEESQTPSRKSSQSSQGSRDDLGIRVRDILSETKHLDMPSSAQGSHGLPYVGYPPKIIDYSLLQRDLQEIQENLHSGGGNERDLLQSSLERQQRESQRYSVDTEIYKSQETSASEPGSRKFLWDHAADVGYTDGYDGQFLGTETETTGSLAKKLLSEAKKHSGGFEPNRKSDDIETESTATNDTTKDVPELDREGSLTPTNTLRMRQENGHESLKENVEDIINRYRTERKEIRDRFKPENDGLAERVYKIPIPEPDRMPVKEPAIPVVLENSESRPSLVFPPSPPSRALLSDQGLAERVQKILNTEPVNYQQPSPSCNGGMAKEVYKILSEDRPDKQVHGILAEALAQERQMLEKLAEQPKLDSSYNGYGMNNATHSFTEEEVRRQLEWSQMSSPGKSVITDRTADKTGMSEFSALGAPFNAFSNAKTFLSTQLQKMSERSFNKSIELKTPYRQAIECYPVYGIQRDSEKGREREADRRDVREAWTDEGQRERTERVQEKVDRDRGMDLPRRGDKLASERFFLTKKDGSPLRGGQLTKDDTSPLRQRTFSDPFEISPVRRARTPERETHTRSKSEEGAALASDLSQYSLASSWTDRRTAASPLKQMRMSDQYERPNVEGRGADLQREAETKSAQGWSVEYHSDASDRRYRSDVFNNRRVTDSTDRYNTSFDTTFDDGSDRNLSNLDISDTSFSFSDGYNIRSFSEGSSYDEQYPRRHLGAFHGDEYISRRHNRDRHHSRMDGRNGVNSYRRSYSEPRRVRRRDYMRNRSLDERHRVRRMCPDHSYHGYGCEERYKPYVTRKNGIRHVTERCEVRFLNDIDHCRKNVERRLQKERDAELQKDTLSRSAPISVFFTPVRNTQMGPGFTNGFTGDRHVSFGEEISHVRLDADSHRVREEICDMVDQGHDRIAKGREDRAAHGRYENIPLHGQDRALFDKHGRNRHHCTDMKTDSRHRNKQRQHHYGNSPPRILMKKKPEGTSPSGAQVTSPSDSDTSASRRISRLRPYRSYRHTSYFDYYHSSRRRPAGSRDVYYTESGDDTTGNDSATTLESTHTGSDDAVGPYFPSQCLGSRKEEASKFPIGIYDTKSNEALSTIEEKSVADDKERVEAMDTAVSKPGKPAHQDRQQLRSRHDNPGDRGDRKGRERLGNPGRDEADHFVEPRSDSGLLPEGEGYQHREADREIFTNSDRKQDMEIDELSRKNQEGRKELDKLEREIENERRRLSEERLTAQMGVSTRSDPGSHLDDFGYKWDSHREGPDSEFRPLVPETQEGLRSSRLHKSDTDLVGLSPSESQKYSSPMLPGTKFLELSSQPSPIFSHHDSVSSPVKVRGTDRVLAEPDRRTRFEQHRTRSPVSERRDMVARTVERSRSHGHMDSGAPPPSDKRSSSERARRDRSASPLEVREEELKRELAEMNREFEVRSGNTSMERSLTGGPDGRDSASGDSHGKRKSQKDKSGITDEEFEDNFPPSKKAQVLRDALQEEYMDSLPPNLNDMWTRFQELNQSLGSDSSISSSRMEKLASLLHNPTQHTVNQFLQEQREAKRRQKEEEEEKMERLKEQRSLEMERQKKEMEEEKCRSFERKKKLLEEKAALEREVRRRELRQRHGLSEEESNGSYSELIQDKGHTRKVHSAPKSQSPSCNQSSKKIEKSKGRDRKVEKKVGKENDKPNGVKARLGKDAKEKGKSNPSDSVDTLFSIPEDSSFDMSFISTGGGDSSFKAKHQRHRHMIDPLMKKLRDRIKTQRDKIDRERKKELGRMDKLKKLEMLLAAKRKGKLSDKAIDVELQYVSTTSTNQTESSTMITDSTLEASSMVESDVVSQGSTTTAKDSSVEMKKPWAKSVSNRDVCNRILRTEQAMDESETMSENDMYEMIKYKKSRSDEKRSSEKPGRKPKASSSAVKRVKDKKYEKMMLSQERAEEFLARHVQNHEKNISPHRSKQRNRSPLQGSERKKSPTRDHRRQRSPVLERERHRSPTMRKQKDVSTMYPSPITVSPQSRRKNRGVYMVSEAIQTTPSVRGGSPTHAYEEVPVAPVPLMSPILTRKSSSSPSAGRRKSSKSPVAGRTLSGSPARSRRISPSPVSRRLSPSQVPKFKSMSTSMSRSRSRSPHLELHENTRPPKSQMFTPETGETDENTDPEISVTHQPSGQGGLAWFVPMKEKPWRQPLKERQAFSVRQEPWQPSSVPQSAWKSIIHGDIMKEKEEVGDGPQDTKFDLDTRGRRIGGSGDTEEEESEVDILEGRKPLSRMSLQEAFLIYKQNMISNLGERQKRVKLASEERHMQHILQLERDKIFMDQRKKEPNPEAHPLSDNLFQPKRRQMTKQECRELTERKYKTLPEVVEKQKLKKRSDEYSLNRLKARLFNRKVQRRVLVKAKAWE